MNPTPRPAVRRRPSWLSVILTSTAIFLAVLALLWVRVSAGEDPVLGARATANVASAGTTTQSSSDSTAESSDDTSSSGDSSDDTSTSSASTGSSSSTSSSTPTTHAS